MNRNSRRFRASGCGLPYHRQGLIWFMARSYKDQPETVRQLIRESCQRAGGENAEALFTYVTTDITMVAVLQRFYIGSETTLYRMVARWYHLMDEGLRRLSEK